MTKEPTIVVAAGLPQAQHAEVRRHAAALGERPSDLVRRAIAEALAKRATESAAPAPVD